MAKKSSKSQLQIIQPELLKSSHSSAQVNDRVKHMLSALLEVSNNHELITALLEVFFDVPPALLRYMGGSIVVTKGLWGADTPKRALQAAIGDRLDQVLEELETGKTTEYATPAEVLCAMYGATMEAPMRYEFVKVYQWCFAKTAVKYHWSDMTTEAEVYQYLGDRTISFEEIRYDYQQIAHDIRRAVVNSGKAKGWGDRQKRQRRNEQRQESIGDTNQQANRNSNTTAAITDNLIQISLF